MSFANCLQHIVHPLQLVCTIYVLPYLLTVTVIRIAVAITSCDIRRLDRLFMTSPGHKRIQGTAQ